MADSQTAFDAVSAHCLIVVC